jgi:putative copper export protein
MNDTLIQAAIWLGALGTLFIFLKRRRSRRVPR